MATGRSGTQGQDSAGVTVTVSLRGGKEGEEQPEIAAYAFSAGGALLSHVPVKGGHAQLSLPQAQDSQAVRVLVGPAPGKDQEPNLAELVRQGAPEAHVRVDPNAEVAPIDLVIDPSIWRCWLDFCFITGTLLKRVMRDGVWIDLPVCGATVDIWEVDPIEIIIPRIPIDVLDWLRHLIVNPPPIVVQPPLGTPGGPFPPPGPGPDPAPFLALSELGGAVAQSQLASEQPVDASFVTLATRIESASHGSAEADTAAPPSRLVLAAPSEQKPDPAALASAIQTLNGVESIRSAAASGSVEALRAALISETVTIKPLLCLLFPRWVTTQVIGQATTDDCGHFSAWVWKGCRQLNLYFTAWQWWFGGFDALPIQILRPLPVSCYTWWNYQCGTEVVLYTSSPFGRTCAPCPPVIADPRWVLAMAIGNWPISRIHGLSSATPADGSNNGLTDGGAPFGGDMRLRLAFDDALAGIGVKYYQVAWKRVGTSDMPQALHADIHRHYAHEVAGNLVVDVYTLGPRTVGTTWPLYEIPPALPPAGDWVYPDAVEDLNNGTFTSAAFFAAPASGLIELHVNLFDSAGDPVDISTVGINYAVPTSTDFSGTIFTENAALDGLVSGNTLVLPLYVDNNLCTAGIDAPTLDGTPASDNCGVLNYTDKTTDQVTLAYHAHHPHRFATYSFALYRGVNELTPPSQSGAVGVGDFSATETAGTLLGECTIAGFSENLYVWAMAIDGWNRLGQYDALSVRAFVLAPAE